jgi:glycosyltransferase involved in cell wall biosynthesis
MAHAMFKEAVRCGHSVTVVVKGREVPDDFEPYEIDGVKVTTDKRTLNHIDVLVTHLDMTEEAEQIAEKRNIPLIQIFHNDSRPHTAKRCDLAIYNTNWILQDAPMPFPCKSIVVHPPIWADDYRVDTSDAQYITLVNLQRPKGVEMFYCLAANMPELQFLGVKGSYGQQIMPPQGLKNVTILENQTDMRNVYRNTKILLMPSSYESYGRCAVEAAVSGIPTIAHRTKGLYEALGESGTYPVPDSDSWACAVRYVLETYDLRSQLARSHGKALDPTGDMQRCLKAIEGVVNERNSHRNQS